MALGDVLGGVVRERERSANRSIADRTATVNEGNLALGQGRLDLAGQQFGAEQESAATQALLTSATQLAGTIKEIRGRGGEVPPSLEAGATQMFEAVQDKPNVQLQIQALFADAVGALTPEQVATQEGETQLTTAETISGTELTPDQRSSLAGLQANKEDRLLQLQDAFSAEQDPRKKTQIGLLINKIINPSKGITINTGNEPGSTALSESRQDYLKDIASNGVAAQDLLNTANLINQSLDEIEGGPLDTGLFSGLREGVANLAILGGFGDEFAKDVANLTTVDALSQKLTIMETQLLKGAINQREFDSAGKINTTIDNPNLANRFATKRMMATGEMNKWMLQRAEQIEDNNPEWGDNKIAKQMRKEFTNIPYFSKTLKDERGLPLFFTEFRTSYQEQFPEDGTSEVLAAWKAGQ